VETGEGDDSAGRQQMLQREILSYLLEHPEAKDTVEGIMHWWLPPAPAWRANDVTRALDALVLKGWLTAVNLGTATRVYGLDRTRRDEILRWLTN
jgi:Fe2+ or Zn2+ uptake regulation protein